VAGARIAAAAMGVLLTLSACTSPRTLTVGTEQAALTALFQTLPQFYELQNMAPARVQRAFGAAPVRGGTTYLTRFGPVEFRGQIPLDSLELSISDERTDLDLFPGARCITAADVETAYGPPVLTPIPDFGGTERAYRPKEGVKLNFEFVGSGRCVTQITVSHGARP